MHNTRMILFRLFYKKYHRSIIEVSQITSLNSALSRFKRLKKCLLFQFGAHLKKSFLRKPPLDYQVAKTKNTFFDFFKWTLDRCFCNT